MDPFAGILPPRSVSSVYRCLELIGALGLIEVFLGLICVAAEILGITLHELTDQKYALEIWGICTGVCVVIAGIWGFLTKLALIKPRARHCMFLLGLCVTVLCGVGCFLMLMQSIKETKKLYMERQAGNLTQARVLLRDRELSVMAPLRAADAGIYLILLGAFLASFLLNCKNIRRIMKSGQSFFPRFKYMRVPGTRRNWEKPEQQDPLRGDRNPEEVVIIDRHGSLWILPTPEVATKSKKANNN